MDRWHSRQGRRTRSCISILSLIILLLAPIMAWGMPAYPGPVFQEQGDGSTVELRLRGDEHFHWYEDTLGYTVVRENGWFLYARLDADGHLASSGLVVGKDDPAAAGLVKGLLPESAIQAQSALSIAASGDGASPVQIAPFGNVQNLVVLVRFSDHAARTLPSEADIDVLMNQPGGDPVLAPTGSVRDVYLENSYGQMTLISSVANWHTVSNTEAYYANGVSGDSTLWEALIEALDAADAYIDFNDFDTDADGYIDSITFLHSGYGAEWDGNPNRIWSHRWAIQSPPGGWVSDEGVRVFDYHISPSLWGTSGSQIGRIGVISHETGHFFGLPDLYDTGGEAGNGIGSWGMMANSWDFNFTQQCPPHFSPWSKIQLGWYSPTVITGPGQFTLNQAETNPEVFRVDQGFPSQEYLLIENRQNAGFDCTIPQGGLAIWHIDDSTGYSTQGYPGQAGWPGNGNHYRVALLQADGAYHLEQDVNRGDSGDMHHATGVDAMGPGPGGHPNTDAYKNGNIIQTGHIISDISASGPSMTFCLNGCSGLAAPSGLDALATGNSTMNVTWNDNSSGEDGFEVERSLDGNNWAVIATTGADITAFGDTGLNPGTTYHYRARAFNNVPEASSWSNSDNDTTTPMPPASPSGMSANPAGTDQIDLAWADNSGNEDGFRVEHSTDGTNFATLTTLPSGSTAYSHGGLAPSSTHHYRVYAYNAGGDSGFDSASATTDDPPPFVDYFAYADQFGSGEVFGNYADTHGDDGMNQSMREKVSGGKKRDRTTYMGHFWRFNIGSGDIITVHANAWQSASDDGDNFVFAWSENDSTYTDLFTVSSQSDANTEMGTIPNTVSGEVWIRVIDTDRTPGNSRSRDMVYVDQLFIRVENDGPPTPPNAPSSLVASSSGVGSIFLTWDDNSPNETGFRLERSPDGSTAWTTVANLGANAGDYLDTGLNASTTYWYRVFAVNGAGDSSASNVASATTDDPPTPPAAPDSLTATSNGHASVTLNWRDNADNETGFQVHRSLNGVDFSIVASIGPPDTESWVDNNVNPDTQYWYQVRSVNELYESAWSNTATATTGSAPNVVLSTVGYKVKGKKRFDLAWSGASSTNVDVYRDGALVATTANDGTYTDATNLKGSGSHTHQVCEAGTAVCSNLTTTNF